MQKTTNDLLSRLRERAARNPRRIVYPESTDPRILRAAQTVAETKMARPILVGSAEAIEKAAKAAGVNLSGVEIADMGISSQKQYAALLLPDWKSRGVMEVEAQTRLQNPMY